MKVPTRSEDVDGEWIKHYLTIYENRRTPNIKSKVSEVHWDIKEATKEGDSHHGYLFKIEITATVQNNGESRNVMYHHFIKFTTLDTIQKEFNKVFINPEREFLFLSEILDKLNAFQARKTGNKYPIYMPEYVVVEKNGEGHVLVIENIEKQGYQNKSTTKLLEVSEAKIALEQLARLHAISYTYYKGKRHTKEENKEAKKLTKKEKIKRNLLTNDEKEKEIFRVEETSDWFISSQDHFIDVASDFLKNHKDHIEMVEKVKGPKAKRLNENQEKKKVEENKYKELIEKITSSKAHITEMNKKAFGERNKIQKILCLNHGDPWNNNILVRNKSNDDISVYFSDWESVHWNTPAYDLNYFLAGALTPELRFEHLDELLKHYHDHFTKVQKALRKNKPVWSEENFKKEFKAVSVWGFLKSLRFSMTLSEAAKDVKMPNKKPGTSCCTTNCLSTKVKECFGRLMMKVMSIGWFLNKFTYKIMRKTTESVLEELVGKDPDMENSDEENSRVENTELYKRFLANIEEGNKRGFFDVPSEDTANDDNTKEVPKDNDNGNVAHKDNATSNDTMEDTHF